MKNSTKERVSTYICISLTQLVGFEDTLGMGDFSEFAECPLGYEFSTGRVKVQAAQVRTVVTASRPWPAEHTQHHLLGLSRNTLNLLEKPTTSDFLRQ